MVAESATSDNQLLLLRQGGLTLPSARCESAAAQCAMQWRSTSAVSFVRMQRASHCSQLQREMKQRSHCG